MRSRPSDADLRLLARLADEGLTVSPTQLERWRGHGLIERAHIRRDSFGGSNVLDHSDDVFESCKVLASVSSQGRPWQYSALQLFEEGRVLSTDAIRDAAAFLLDQQLIGFRRAWLLAETGAELSRGADPLEWVADVATKAAGFAGRNVRSVVREEIELVHPHLSTSRLREATETALIWRIANISAPLYLTDEQRNWARHGMAEPLDPLSDLTIPLPSERAACVATITWAEAVLARWSLGREENSLLGQQWVLNLATWRVVAWRMLEHFDHPERPLSDVSLGRIRGWIEEDYPESVNGSSEALASQDPQSDDD